MSEELIKSMRRRLCTALMDGDPSEVAQTVRAVLRESVTLDEIARNSDALLGIAVELAKYFPDQHAFYERLHQQNLFRLNPLFYRIWKRTAETEEHARKISEIITVNLGQNSLNFPKNTPRNDRIKYREKINPKINETHSKNIMTNNLTKNISEKSYITNLKNFTENYDKKKDNEKINQNLTQKTHENNFKENISRKDYCTVSEKIAQNTKQNNINMHINSENNVLNSQSTQNTNNVAQKSQFPNFPKMTEFLLLYGKDKNNEISAEENRAACFITGNKVILQNSILDQFTINYRLYIEKLVKQRQKNIQNQDKINIYQNTYSNLLQNDQNINIRDKNNQFTDKKENYINNDENDLIDFKNQNNNENKYQNDDNLFLNDTVNKTLLKIKPLPFGSTPTVNTREANAFVQECLRRPAFDSSDDSEDFFLQVGENADLELSRLNKNHELHKSINIMEIWQSPQKHEEIKLKTNPSIQIFHNQPVCNVQQSSMKIGPSTLTSGCVTNCSDDISSYTLVKPVVVAPFAKFKQLFGDRLIPKSNENN